MKKTACIFSLILSVFCLSSCFGSTTFPNMVEYTEDEVLEIASEKYEIDSYIFTDLEFYGIVTSDESGNFELENYSCNMSVDFINGDNVKTAFTSFAGKNGGHDIQGMYRDFLCYVALGINENGDTKYVYYNTNLDKYAKIADTIGSSDYPFDVLPSDIDSNFFDTLSLWTDMYLYLSYFSEESAPYMYDFSGDRLAMMRPEPGEKYTRIEYYLEDGNITYDLYYLPEKDISKLVYSSSNRYGAIYDYYGLDTSKYVDVDFTVEQSLEGSSLEVINGTATIKEVEGTILYTQLSITTQYKSEFDGNIITHESNTFAKEQMQINIRILVNKIDGINHADTTKMYVSDFYIFYEKTTA